MVERIVLSGIFFHFPFAVFRLPFAIFHFPFVICHLPCYCLLFKFRDSLKR